MELTLEKAMDLALQLNRNILLSRYAHEGKELSVSSAKTAFDLRLVPYLSAGLTGNSSSLSDDDLSARLLMQRKLENGTTFALGPIFSRSDEIYNSGFDFSIAQPLLRGRGRDVNLDGIRSAEYSLGSAGRSLYQARVNAILDTVTIFYETVRQTRFIALYESMSGRLRRHAELARMKEQVGLASPIDTYRAEIRLKDAEDSLLRAKESLSNTKDRLKGILSLAMNTELVITEPKPVSDEYSDLEELTLMALVRRVELAQAMSDIEESQRKEAILEHNILPELNLVINYARFGESDSFSNSIGLEEQKWGMRLQSSTDLFRTAEKNAYVQGRLTTESVRINTESKKDDIRRQVRSQFLALSETKKSIAIRQEQIKQAQGKLALAQLKFAYNMANNYDVIEAETELLRSEINLVSAQIEYAVGTYTMKAVSGTLL